MTMNILDMPHEILYIILGYSDSPFNYRIISLVCKLFHEINLRLAQTKMLEFMTRKITIHSTKCDRGKYKKYYRFWNQLPNQKIHDISVSILFESDVLIRPEYRTIYSHTEIFDCGLRLNSETHISRGTFPFTDYAAWILWGYILKDISKHLRPFSFKTLQNISDFVKINYPCSNVIVDVDKFDSDMHSSISF